MKELKFNLAQLCEQIEKVWGKITTPFSLRYPTDYRCRYSLRVFVETEKESFLWDEAESADTVARLLGMEVVAFEWNRYSDTILKVIVRN